MGQFPHELGETNPQKIIMENSQTLVLRCFVALLVCWQMFVIYTQDCQLAVEGYIWEVADCLHVQTFRGVVTRPCGCGCHDVRSGSFFAMPPFTRALCGAVKA